MGNSLSGEMLAPWGKEVKEENKVRKGTREEGPGVSRVERSVCVRAYQLGIEYDEHHEKSP